jgi:hypothetical protein
MSHPFQKIFDSALRKSTPDAVENEILLAAERLKEKGYSVNEIHEVLRKFSNGLIDSTESAIANEALEEFSRYL